MNELESNDYENRQLKILTETEFLIYEIKDKYMALTINGIDDKSGFMHVKAARLDIKSKRIDVEKKRKSLNENALKYQRAINTEAKRITGLIEPIETYLSKLEEDFESEQNRIKQAEKDAEEAKIKAAWEAREAELRAEAAAKLQAEREALAVERAALEAEKARVAAQALEQATIIAAAEAEHVKAIEQQDRFEEAMRSHPRETVIEPTVVDGVITAVNVIDRPIQGVCLTGLDPYKDEQISIIGEQGASAKVEFFEGALQSSCVQKIDFDMFDQLVRGLPVPINNLTEAIQLGNLSFSDMQDILDHAQGGDSFDEDDDGF